MKMTPIPRASRLLVLTLSLSVSLAGGGRVSAADCNGNGLPDDADIASRSSKDCNSNGVPDECDIASGGSSDTDANGRPDECGDPEPRATGGASLLAADSLERPRICFSKGIPCFVSARVLSPS
ncbi:MAG: hypothetical protein HY721_25800 [Planctomycetes bacterium]|nr:hypothetical protein [Planctomycetota bacterium]